MMYPVQQPARSRFPQHSAMHSGSGENDPIVQSPIGGMASSQQYRSAEHSSASTPLFQNVHRRKRDNRHDFASMQQRNSSEHFYSNVVQTAMKGILLSPVLVLVVWSITAISWTNQQLSLKKAASDMTFRQRNDPSLSMSGAQSNNRRSWMFGRRRTQQPPPQQSPHIVQPAYLRQPMQGSAEDYYQDPVPMVGMAPELEQQLIPLTSNAANNFVVTAPEIASSSGKKQYYYNFPEQQQSPQMATGDVVNGALPQVVALKDPVTGKTQYYYTFPEQGKSPDAINTNVQVENPVVMLPEGGAVVEAPLVGDVVADEPAEDLALLLAQQQQPLQQVDTAMRTMSRLQSPHSNGVKHDGSSHHANGNQNTHHVQYYFYDPKSTKKDQHGRLHLPQVVYDTYGKVVSLKSLTKAVAAPLLMQEPNQPILTMIHQNATTLNATQFNYTHTHPPVVETRQKRKMSLPKQIYNFSNSKGESSTAEDDSSMIICTVGVMALFVGALSARRLRHQRSILSVCIENEALEDDAAYDAAYSTTTNPNAFGSHYNTFAQGWKGDLEKFDV